MERSYRSRIKFNTMKKIFIPILLVLISVIGIAAYALFIAELPETMVYNTSEKNSIDDITEFLPAPSSWERGLSWAATIRRVKEIKPGRYQLQKGLTAWDAIALLRQGDNHVLLIRTDESRTLRGFTEKLSTELAYTSEKYLKAFVERATGSSEINEKNIAIATTYLFADTYDFRYTDSPEEIAMRFYKIDEEFWNSERTKKAEQIGLTKNEVYILASMVKGEAKHFEEATTIAGLYINRLKVPMKMQCDATVAFVNEEKTGLRVSQNESKVQSPYNTYEVDGLPPGPIFITEKKYLDAVLNYKQHNYIYMCAMDDGSGHHWFTDNSRAHINFANRYHRYLDRLNIRE
jgi:UPF0755 protein